MSYLNSKTYLILLLFIYISGCANFENNMDAYTFSNENVKFYTLDVGAGNCQIMTCEDPKKAVIFDCGSLSPTVAKDRILMYLLDEVGIQNYDEINVSVSHADMDHLNLVPYIASLVAESNVNKFDTRVIDNITFGGLSKDYSSDKKAMLLGTLKTNGQYFTNPANQAFSYSADPVPSLSCDNTAKTWKLISGLKVDDRDSASNASSAVYAIVIPGLNQNTIIYVTGDMTGATADKIIENYGMGLYNNFAKMENERVMVVSHHGSSSHGSNNATWANFTKPTQLIISAGDRENFHHPKCEIILNYLNASSLPQNITLEHDLSCYERNERNEYELKTYKITQDIWSTFNKGNMVEGE